jgi:hypothetical protein
VCKAGSEHVQALEDAQSSETKASAEDGEESVEEDRRPAEFGNYTDNERRIEQKKYRVRTEQDDDLEDDEQAGDDGPEDTGGLIGDGAPSAITIRADVE